MRFAKLRHGVHPKESKYTAATPIVYILPKVDEVMIFPMVQHIGAPCKPCVRIGDYVMVGQTIGESDGFVSSPVVTTVSGVVESIDPILTPNGTRHPAIFIRNDDEYRDHPRINHMLDYKGLSHAECIEVIREAGIVGLGGAGFPTHVKLSPPADKPIDTIFINAAECEPFLTNDHRVLLEETERILLGLDVLLHMFPNTQGIVGIEDNKPDAIARMRDMSKDPRVSIVSLQSRYPHGAEKQLIRSCTGREVPSGGLPMDVGAIVLNVDTTIALHRAFFRGRPLMRKVITVAGSAAQNPGNYKVRLGMTYASLLDQIGGTKEPPYKIIMGGPMMGVSHHTLDIPTVKTSSGLLLFDEKEGRVPEEEICIRCGKCVDHCPMGLSPLDLNRHVLNNHPGKFRAHDGLDCIECGSCSYICPSKRHLVQSITVMRRELLAKKS